MFYPSFFDCKNNFLNSIDKAFFQDKPCENCILYFDGRSAYLSQTTSSRGKEIILALPRAPFI